MNTVAESIIDWLLDGDVSIRYQTCRDLQGYNDLSLRKRISEEGWGAQYLSARKPDGHWGLRFYQPKWISSHYTLLDLRNLCIDPENSLIRESVHKIGREEKGVDGGINPSGSVRNSDVCINGMYLNYASYFNTDEELLKPVVDFIISQIMPDGGFNCQLNRSGAKHSSMHTTISAVEGITEYRKRGYSYRYDELHKAELSSREFLLKHQLYISDRTEKVIKSEFLKFPYPPRWKYNILRAMDYLRYSGAEWDERMKAATDDILSRQRPDGKWKQMAKHPGQVHFEMEIAGMPGRWNTLIALRILKHYNLVSLPVST